MKMRNFSELELRIQKSEQISPKEMAEKYYPTEADYQQVRSWLLDQGFNEVKTDGPRMGVYMSGSAAQLQRVLQVKFIKRLFDGARYLSVVNAPSVPATIAPLILGIDGLQPQFHLQPLDTSSSPRSFNLAGK